MFEDDTFVAAFAFVHLAARRGLLVSPANRVRGTPSAIPFRAGLTRRAPGALGLSGPPISHSVVKSRAAQPGLRAIRTIKEHMPLVKRGWRDLLDRRVPTRYSRPDDREGRCLGEFPWEHGPQGLREERGVTMSLELSLT